MILTVSVPEGEFISRGYRSSSPGTEQVLIKGIDAFLYFKLCIRIKGKVENKRKQKK